MKRSSLEEAITNSGVPQKEEVPNTPSATPRKKRRKVLQTQASIPTQSVQQFFAYLLDVEQCQYPHSQHFTTYFETLKIEKVVEYLDTHCQHFSSDEYKQAIRKEQDLIEKYSERMISSLATSLEGSKRNAFQLYNMNVLRSIQIQILLRFLFWSKLQHQIGDKNNKKIRDPLNKKWIQSLCTILEIPINLMDLDTSSETDLTEQISLSKFFELIGCLDTQTVCNSLHTMERFLNDIFLSNFDCELSKPFANFGVSIAFIYKHFQLHLPNCLKEKLDEFVLQLKGTQQKAKKKEVIPTSVTKSVRKKKVQIVSIAKPTEDATSQEPSTPVQAFKSKKVSMEVENALQRMMDSNQSKDLKTSNLTVNQTKMMQPNFFKVWKYTPFTPSKKKQQENEPTPSTATTLAMDSERILFPSPSKVKQNEELVLTMKPTVLQFDDQPILLESNIEKPVSRTNPTTVRKKGFIKL